MPGVTFSSPLIFFFTSLARWLAHLTDLLKEQASTSVERLLLTPGPVLDTRRKDGL